MGSTGTVVIYAENNYENNVDLWMVKEINLTEYNSALNDVLDVVRN